MEISKYEYTMELLAAMASETIARKRKKSKFDTFRKFMTSKTAGMLFDDSLDFWMNGPDYIANEYFKECKAGRPSV